MRIAIHQPHYFPWIGYLNKMAKVDKFILLDNVQLTDKSNMFRNKFLSMTGKEKFLTVCFLKKGYMEKAFKEVELNSVVNWQKDHINFIAENYKKADNFDEIWEKIHPIFSKRYKYLCDVAIDSLLILKDILEIPTEIVFQSSLNFDQDLKKNDLVLNICQALNANQYLSGNGARKYMDLDLFETNEVEVKYQQFMHPEYKQCGSNIFIPNLSTLDLLFNCGIKQSKEIFWENVKSTHEFNEANNHD